MKETGCCKIFNPEPWQEKTITWKNKLFVKDRVASFLHIPLNMNQIMIKNVTKITKENGFPETPVMLSDENSLWGSDIYIAVSKEIPDSTMRTISGTFLSKVFEGEFKNIGTWIEQMKKFVASKGKQIKKMYFYYTTCPACAKAYGKNYVVILAEI